MPSPTANDRDGDGRADRPTANDRDGDGKTDRPTANDRDGDGRADRPTANDRDGDGRADRPTANDRDGDGRADRPTANDRDGDGRTDRPTANGERTIMQEQSRNVTHENSDTFYHRVIELESKSPSYFEFNLPNDLKETYSGKYIWVSYEIQAQA